MTVFGFSEESPDTGRPVMPVAPRGRRGPSRRRRSGLRLALFGLVVVAVLAAGTAYALTRLRLSPPPDYPGPGSGSVYVQVATGDTATAIGRLLFADGVVASVGAFRLAAERDPRSVNIEAGYYRLRLRMRAVEALTLLENPANLVHSVVTLPDGTSIRHVPELIASHTQIPLAAVQAALSDPAALGLPAYAAGKPEGFLYPATYDVAPGTTALNLLREMVGRFQTVAAQVNLVAGAAALGYTPLQIVTIASIIERETAAPAVAAKVAEVFYNRLRAGLPLGSEFTYAYSGGDPKSPYNTYTHHGFPPGPYDSPGRATLLAALHPAPGPWLYFVTLPRGPTLFATDEAQFFADQATCRAQGGCR